MAILFSKVTMRDDYNESEFFVSGFPQEPDDLEGWTAYHEFLDEITEDMWTKHSYTKPLSEWQISFGSAISRFCITQKNGSKRR